MSGYYQLTRGWLKHPVFGTDPLCRRAAWAWLIEEAAWKEARVGFGGKSVVLKRGQLSHSLRHIAEAWRWKKDAVARFLDRLEVEEMIVTNRRASVVLLSRLGKTETANDTASATDQLVITICNYDNYQAEPKSSETPTAPVIETPPRQDRDSTATTLKEDNNSKKLNTGGGVDVRALLIVGKRILEIMRVDNDPRWTGNYSLAEVWLKRGCDPELDIYPTVERLVAQNANGPPITSLKYFDRAVTQAHADRNRILPEPSNVNRSSPKPAKPTQESDRRIMLETLGFGAGVHGMGDDPNADGAVLDGEYRRSH